MASVAKGGGGAPGSLKCGRLRQPLRLAAPHMLSLFIPHAMAGGVCMAVPLSLLPTIFIVCIGAQAEKAMILFFQDLSVQTGDFAAHIV